MFVAGSLQAAQTWPTYREDDQRSSQTDAELQVPLEV